MKLTLTKPLPAAAQAAMARASGAPIAKPPVATPAPPAPKPAAVVRAASPKPAAVRAAPKPATSPNTPPDPKSKRQIRKRLKRVRTAAHEQRVAWCDEDLAVCQARFPALFDAAHPLPLALEIDRALAPAVNGRWRAYRMLADWTKRPAYLAAVARGGPRYNLDASIDGEINAYQQKVAQSALAELQEKQPEGKAA